MENLNNGGSQIIDDFETLNDIVGKIKIGYDAVFSEYGSDKGRLAWAILSSSEIHIVFKSLEFMRNKRSEKIWKTLFEESSKLLEEVGKILDPK